MKSILVLAVLAQILSAGLLPLFHTLFVRLNLLDLPDSRKLHTTPVPRCGGIAIVLAYLSSIGFLFFLPSSAHLVFEQYGDFLVRLVPATILIFLVGALDDWINLRPVFKLAGQVTASSLACLAGLRLFDAPPSWDWLSFAITVFWLVLCSNAFNLIDGTDGLAGTLGILSSLGMITAALSLDYYPLGVVFAPLLGATIPFLRMNWPPARIFLGDAGSLTIGFLLGCGGAALSRRLPEGTGIVAAVLLLILPLAELAFSSARRLLRGQSIFEADALHFHHQLKRQGLGSAAVLATLGLFGFVGTALAVLQIQFRPLERVLAITAFLLLLGWGLARLRYPELVVLSEALVGGRFRLWIRQQIELRVLESELMEAKDALAVWRCLSRSAARLGLLELRLNLNGLRWEQAGFETGQQKTWRIRIDLPLQSWVNFRVPVAVRRLDNASGEFAAMLIKVLSERRLLELSQQSLPPVVAPDEELVSGRFA